MRPARGLSVALAAVLVATPPPALAGSGTGTQTLRVNISPVAKLHMVQTSVSLVHAGNIFADFTGSATVQFKIRTTISTGSGSLTASASEFSPSNGPSIANSDLRYTCSGASLGAACSGVQTMTTSSQSNIVTVGSGACTGTGCSGTDPNTVTVNLNLADSPTFKTGSYSTTITFTASAP